jgi:Tfp pilus assembly protein PilX
MSALTDRSQQGAALPTTLILMIVIVLLAISAIRSSKFDFLMVSNLQVQERAFNAAEAGIAQAIATANFDPNILTPVALPAGTLATDNYAAVITTQAQGLPQSAPGNSWSMFVAYPFQIVSTGTSVRSASSVHTQGVMVLSPSSSNVQGAGGL